MSEISPSWKWEQKLIYFAEGVKYPIMQLTLNNGTAIDYSVDYLSSTVEHAIWAAWQYAFTSIGKFAAGKDITNAGSLPGLPDSTRTLVTIGDFSIVKNVSVGSGGSYMSTIDVSPSNYRFLNTTGGFPGAGGDKETRFAPYFLMFDEVGQMYMYVTQAWGVYEEVTNTTVNAIGVINYIDVPIANIEPNVAPSTGYGQELRRVHNTTNAWLLGQVVPMQTDPYAEVPTSGPGGGTGVYTPFTTDDIDYQLLPEVSAVGTGFLSLWCPNEQQMLNLSAYMWNADVGTLAFWRRLVADPIQLVYGLNIIPLNLRAKGIVGSSPEEVVVGAISTKIKMDYLTSQWVELDCGTIDIEENMLGSYLDYDPFTKVDIYLPYIGYRPLRVDDIMPGTIQVKYRIDLLTGACVAQIKSTKSNEHDDTLNSIVYQFMGNCATQVPVTATQYADAVRSAISIAAAIGTVAVLAGTGAGAGAGAAMGETLLPTANTGALVPIQPQALVNAESAFGISDAAFGLQLSAMDNARSAGGGGSAIKNAGIIHSAASAGSNVMGIKPSIERSGALGGAAGMLATQKPYLVFTRPRIAHPENQNTYTGYPSFMTERLSNLEGFTQIQAIHLEGLACTTNELAELDSLLKSGVIF